ncbi:family 43 glycosylhydrolase [Flavivirga amylovorans]|uniref:Family 43 glycosylhydrolase n=1 Tax=Flavivirga amylovorans TaxID=870486 RepID=A0ABT8WVY7_9FLAO|nr:family 43 glycosylhydrolase [Flavivirga amylovorans]MDO5985834.1 family 43 glycosylhydrolase [Flavivirga amylovorans]
MKLIEKMSRVLSIVVIALLVSCTQTQKKQDQSTKGFPQFLPEDKPDMPLSKAVARNFDTYDTPHLEDNELYTQFKYTEIKGLDYNNFDGTITRRDPSKVIKRNGKYYVWYTKRHTSVPVLGVKKANDTIAARDWDLAEIWYATSTDGFNWKEEGVAVARPAKPNPGWRSVTTTDILEWKGKYYLYYQAFQIDPAARGDDCPVAVSYADSPDGPWTPTHKIVIPNGTKDEWDGFSIHDPYPLVYKGKIYLYYKSDFDTKARRVRMQGLAIADNPLGPFKKHPLNPVLNSGHETTMFPFKDGIAALVTRNGNEHFTIQYAPDGVNFEVKSIVEMMPYAPSPYIPNTFADDGNGRGITWGICHNIKAAAGKGRCSILMRFDCDLSLDVNDPEFKKHEVIHKPDFYYRYGLSKVQRERIEKETSTDINQ